MSRSTKPRKRTHSIANPTIFTSPADAPKLGQKRSTATYGSLGEAKCPACEATVGLRKASYSDDTAGTKKGIKPGAPIFVRHRIGGGLCSNRSGDIPCLGSYALFPGDDGEKG